MLFPDNNKSAGGRSEDHSSLYERSVLPARIDDVDTTEEQELTMWNWFLTSWNESDSFKIVTCVIGAAATALILSDRRSAIVRPLVGFVIWIFRLPSVTMNKSRSSSGTRPIPTPLPFKLAVDPKPPSQQELTDWISEVRTGCVVSFVEDVGESQVVHKGTVGAISNDLAWIVWNTDVCEHPFTGGLGPDGQSESEHSVELILKQHKLGDRGVTWDPSGVVLVSTGWSVFSWPKFERLP